MAPQHHPHLQCAEATRQLGAVVPEREVRCARRGDHVDVPGGHAERIPQCRVVAHQHAAGIDRDVQPLVGIERHGIRASETCEQTTAGRREHREPAIRAISVQPQPRRPHRSAAASIGSTAPVFTSPALTTTQTGTRPARRSSSIARSSASSTIRHSASTGIRRTASRPRPSIAAARGIDRCTSSDAYTTGSPGSARTPRRLTSGATRLSAAESPRSSP